MQQLPLYVPIVFGLTMLLALYLFHRATQSQTALWLLLGWGALQTALGLTGFYQVINPAPPRFPLLVLPPLLLVVGVLSTKRGQRFIDGLDLRLLTLFHVVRVPVEAVLFWLFMQGAVPQLMTFEGRNFDILSGLSAPVLYYVGFAGNRPKQTILLIWNVVCLGLVINIAVNGLLSAPTPLQQFAFDQPNIALAYFPFVLLPSLVVPMVIFAHLAAIRRSVYPV
ncbi:hypothetical protein [Fibrella aquatilis]|uniref:Uncharacterized protein n=1 Tax=Fibrella aquatilis TaxID=2817059 RepID=A0A939G057_9BACT|nr:hypothetical protein [Fibrella aquatilis]MBO0929937.1 hypothetical protein [Fibrella aquatilis]